MTAPGEVADDAAYELGAAEGSEPDDKREAESEGFDPTATTGLESELRSLEGAAQALEED